MQKVAKWQYQSILRSVFLFILLHPQYCVAGIQLPSDNLYVCNRYLSVLSALFNNLLFRGLFFRLVCLFHCFSQSYLSAGYFACILHGAMAFSCSAPRVFCPAATGVHGHEEECRDREAETDARGEGETGQKCLQFHNQLEENEQSEQSNAEQKGVHFAAR